MAVKREYKNAEGKHEADFFTVICWRGLADLVKMYLSKGDRCGVAGSIQNRSWQDKNGITRYVTEIIADKVEFQNSRRPEEGEQTSAPAQAEFTQVEDDELPF